MPLLRDFRARMALESGPYVGQGLVDVRAWNGSDTTKLVCLQYPVQSGIPQDDIYVDRPLYRPNAVRDYDHHRYVQSYEPTTGTLNIDLPWELPPFPPDVGSTYGFLEGFTYGDWEIPPGYTYGDLEGMGADGPGEVFEILGPFDVPTMHRLINDGLKKCWITVDVPAQPTQGATYHDLTASIPWLQDPGHIRAVGYLAESEDRNSTDPYMRVVRGQVVRDGGRLYLDTGTRSFNDTDVLYLKCYKQAYYHCAPNGGQFGDQEGLSAEDDSCPVDPEYVASAALLIGWSRYGHLLELNANQRLLRDQAATLTWFNDQARKHFTAVQPTLSFVKQRWFGPPVRVA
jgi:hypothetical protein